MADRNSRRVFNRPDTMEEEHYRNKLDSYRGSPKGGPKGGYSFKFHLDLFLLSWKGFRFFMWPARKAKPQNTQRGSKEDVDLWESPIGGTRDWDPLQPSKRGCPRSEGACLLAVTTETDKEFQIAMQQPFQMTNDFAAELCKLRCRPQGIIGPVAGCFSRIGGHIRDKCQAGWSNLLKD